MDTEVDMKMILIGTHGIRESLAVLPPMRAIASRVMSAVATDVLSYLRR